jgi:hypothetical protein
MTLPRTTADVLSGHVVFEVESVDWMYLLSGLAGAQVAVFIKRCPTVLTKRCLDH